MIPVKTLPILGSQVEVLISGAMTEGRSLTLMEVSPPGGGPPPHMHQNEDETFHVVEGEYEFLVDGAWVRGLPGDTFHTNRGSVHTFRNSGQSTGRLLMFVVPAAFEHFLEEISPLTIPDDIPKLIDIAGKYGITFPPRPAG
ncbi:MAG: cupin domain-containing protein [Terracidiphilus sp.]